MTRRTLDTLSKFIAQLDKAYGEVKQAPVGLKCNKCSASLDSSKLTSYKYANGRQMLKGPCPSCKKQAIIPDTRALLKPDPDPIMKQSIEEYLTGLREKNKYVKKEKPAKSKAKGSPSTPKACQRQSEGLRSMETVKEEQLIPFDFSTLEITADDDDEDYADEDDSAEDDSAEDDAERTEDYDDSEYSEGIAPHAEGIAPHTEL